MKAQRKRSTIFARLLIPMVIVAALQSVVFMWIILQGGVSDRLDKNAYDILSQQVTNRTNEFAKRIGGWSNLSDTSRTLTRIFKEQDIQGESKLSKDASRDLLGVIAPYLVTLLRQNKVNGAYVILANSDAQSPQNDMSRYGICIRDMDPDSGNKQTDDLLIARAPSIVASNMNIALDSWWESTYTFTGEEADDFFYKPLQAGQSNKTMAAEDYRYWSRPYRLSGAGAEMLSCSIPLFTESGAVFAVLGVEIKTDYMLSFLPTEEMSASGKGVYMLASRKDDNFTSVLTSGYMSTRYMQQGTTLGISQNSLAENCYMVQDGSNTQLIAGVGDLNLYSRDSMFKDDRYCLLALVGQKELLQFSRDVRGFVLLASGISLGLSLLGAFAIGRFFTTPIKRLAKKVRGGGLGRNIESVGVAEIDDLVDAIQVLHEDISQSENKTADIIHMSGLLVGTFELDRGANRVFADREFFHILGRAAPMPEHLHNPDAFAAALEDFQQYLVEEDTENDARLYRMGDRWIKFKSTQNEQKTLGILLDVTAEVNERKQIEYERDHDLLTGLLNRRAFHTAISDIFDSGKTLGIAAMVMMDVDNLKYVNDSFGHDCGDTYLRLVGQVLKSVAGETTIVSRMSGDEFVAFMYNGTDLDSIYQRIEAIKQGFHNAQMPLPGGEIMGLRVSGGSASYPKDSKEPNSLLKFADFTMLQAKRKEKGSFGVFQLEEYRKNRHLVESVDEIYRLIEGRSVDYYFQPIVHVQTGEIHAYEALMRPLGETIKGPAEALSLAKAAGCLYHMERLTWSKSLEKIEQHLSLFGNTRLFINSIPNQNLHHADFEAITAQYSKLLSRVVVEVTEEERAGEEAKKWFRRVQKLGIEIAIDDYGSGYNGQVMLLDLSPGYVKVDMSIVRGVTTDKNRQEVIRTLVHYGSERNIKIIAEGVETVEELKCLVELGIQYVQGYILQRPLPLPTPLSAEAKAALAALHNNQEL